MSKSYKIKYSKYKVNQNLIVTSSIDGYREGEVVVVVNNIKIKRNNYYIILVKGSNYNKPRPIRVDYVKPI